MGHLVLRRPRASRLSKLSRAKAPARGLEAYPDAPRLKIDRENYMPFIAE